VGFVLIDGNNLTTMFKLMNLRLEHDLDILKMHLHTNNEVAGPRLSNVNAKNSNEKRPK